MNIDDVSQRAYAMVCETRAIDNPWLPIPFRWRMSQAVWDALVAETRYVGADPGIETRLFGYPVTVDETLPVDALQLDGPSFGMAG